MKHYLSLCAIAKDEDELIREWIAHHLLLGVEHFYLYDNESRTPLAELLDDHVRAGAVTLHRVPGRHQHLPSYEHCARNYAHQTRWLGFLDIDEFVCLKKDYDLRLFLMCFEEHPGMSANWATFGSGGQLGYPEGRVHPARRYQWRFPRSHPVNIHVKTFCDPRRIERFSTPHNAVFKDGATGVNEDFLPVHGPYSPVRTAFIQVNHYLYRSQRQYMEKMARGRSNASIRFDENEALQAFIRQTGEASVPDTELAERTARRKEPARQATARPPGKDLTDAALWERLEDSLRREDPQAGLDAAARLRVRLEEGGGGPDAPARLWRAVVRLCLAFRDAAAARVVLDRLLRLSDDPADLLLTGQVLRAGGDLTGALTACLAARELAEPRAASEPD